MLLYSWFIASNTDWEILLVISLLLKVEGVSEMIITDMKHKNIGRGGTYIICYDGTIKLGSTDSQPRKATIFAFQCDADEMSAMHKKWSSFDHPSVMKSLGCSWGSRHHSKYGFVAFPMFHLTFSDLIAKGSRAVEMGRFTEVFTEAVRYNCTFNVLMSILHCTTYCYLCHLATYCSILTKFNKLKLAQMHR